MRRELLSLLISASLIGTAHAQDEPDPNAVLRKLGSTDREVRLKAVEESSTVVYSIEDPTVLAQFRQLLLGMLAQETDSDARASVAAALQSYLSHEGTPTADFLKAEPYLTDSDESVRQFTWMAFTQQASQPSLNDEIDERLLALTGHKDKEVQMQALNWAIEASGSREAVMGSPLSKLGSKTLTLCQEWSDNPDPVLRNMAIYGLLSKFERAPETGLKVLAAHLDDSWGDTRSLVLDFITQRGLSKPQLAELAPALLARFRSRPAGKDFPLQADAELGPAANPPQSEVFRLAIAMAVLGPLPDDVWTYLLDEATRTESPEMLVQLAQVQGKSGRPLMGKIIEGKDSKMWLQWANAFVDTGLPAQYLGAVIAELGVRPLTYPKDDFESSYATSSLLLILANSDSDELRPEAIAAAQRHLTSSSPRVRVAAIYALSVFDPKGPGGQTAVKALMEGDWSELYTGTEMLTCAVWRLKDSGLKATPNLVIDDRTQNALLAWVLGQPAPNDGPPPFLEMYQEGRQDGRAEGGTGTDQILVQLGWLADHPQPPARPGLERLAKHPDPQIRAAAEKALAALAG